MNVFSVGGMIMADVNHLQQQKKETYADKYLMEFLLSEQLKSYIQVIPYDPVTLLPNRKSFIDQLERFIKISERYDTVLSMAWVDIDAFSAVKATFGDSKSKEVLKEFSEVIKEHIRDTDLIAYWGRDEFVWLMPHTTRLGAEVAAEKMRKTILVRDYRHVGKLSCSIGVCQYQAGESLKVFLKRTCEQKEIAIKEGRNRVAAYVNSVAQVD